MSVVCLLSVMHVHVLWLNDTFHLYRKSVWTSKLVVWPLFHGTDNRIFHNSISFSSNLIQVLIASPNGRLLLRMRIVTKPLRLNGIATIDILQPYRNLSMSHPIVPSRSSMDYLFSQNKSVYPNPKICMAHYGQTVSMEWLLLTAQAMTFINALSNPSIADTFLPHHTAAIVLHKLPGSRPAVGHSCNATVGLFVY